MRSEHNSISEPPTPEPIGVYVSTPDHQRVYVPAPDPWDDLLYVFGLTHTHLNMQYITLNMYIFYLYSNL